MTDKRITDLICITVSTKYDDILSLIIHQNQQFFTKWYIITHPDDADTIGVVTKAGYSNIQLVYYDMYKGATFNKGGAIRSVQETLQETHKGKPVLILDSDIYLPDNFHEVVSAITIQPDTLYGVSQRYDYSSYRDFKDNTNAYNYPPSKGFFGFFQLYKHSLLKLYKPSENCSVCDATFTMYFKRKVNLPLTVKHLGTMMANWDGRKSKDDFVSKN